MNDFRHSLNESIDSAEPSLQPNNTETVAPPAISDTSTDSTKDSANNDEPKRSTS
ncbi:MAG: hypothetical protein ACI831_000748 [Candidatus Azotimanducaceae bacterium]